MKSYVRIVDRVTVKGSKIPMSLYTIDADTSQLKLEDNLDELKNPKAAELKMKRHLRLKRIIKSKALKGKFHVEKLF